MPVMIWLYIDISSPVGIHQKSVHSQSLGNTTNNERRMWTIQPHHSIMNVGASFTPIFLLISSFSVVISELPAFTGILYGLRFPFAYNLDASAATCSVTVAKLVYYPSIGRPDAKSLLVSPKTEAQDSKIVTNKSPGGLKTGLDCKIIASNPRVLTR